MHGPIHRATSAAEPLTVPRLLGALLVCSSHDSRQKELAKVTMNLHEIGKLVRERRVTLGLSQDRLARMAGLSRATINQLETAPRAADGQPHGERELQGAVRCRSAGQGVFDWRGASSLLPHVATFLDKAPLPLVVSAVE